MIPEEFHRLMLWWGPGILILMVLVYGFLRLAHYWIEKTMQVRSQKLESTFGLARQYVEQFLGAQRSQADALSRLASSVEHRESVDSFEHQEILIALKAMHQDIDAIGVRRSGDHCVFHQDPGMLERLRSTSGEPKQSASNSRLAPASTLPGEKEL